MFICLYTYMMHVRSYKGLVTRCLCMTYIIEQCNVFYRQLLIFLSWEIYFFFFFFYIVIEQRGWIKPKILLTN